MSFYLRVIDVIFVYLGRTVERTWVDVEFDVRRHSDVITFNVKLQVVRCAEILHAHGDRPRMSKTVTESKGVQFFYDRF